VPICERSGLHSTRLLPHYPALKAHLDTLEAMPPPSFSKPPHLGPLDEGITALKNAYNVKQGVSAESLQKVLAGYGNLCATLWDVASEFDVRGYGGVLREKLTTKWCDCGCSTDHLGEVCERTVREEEEENGVRPGKEREWDGRGPCSRPSASRASHHFKAADTYMQAAGFMDGRRRKRKTSGTSSSVSAGMNTMKTECRSAR